MTDTGNAAWLLTATALVLFMAHGERGYTM
jgi:ammonia channel protein AmtB